MFGSDLVVWMVLLFEAIFLKANFNMLYRLSMIGKGDLDIENGIATSSTMFSITVKSPHCTHCGHPGRKSVHIKIACKQCAMNGSQTCMKKPSGFKCTCSSCDEVHLASEFLYNLSIIFLLLIDCTYEKALLVLLSLFY